MSGDRVAVIALDLDRRPLDAPAGSAVTFEVACDRGEVTVQSSDHRHRLATAAAFLAEDP